LIANHQDVISGAIEELAQYIPGSRWAVTAVNSLIAAQTLDLDAGSRRNIVQYLIQAGIGSRNAQVASIPGH
jgi:hypothetical protein